MLVEPQIRYRHVQILADSLQNRRLSLIRWFEPNTCHHLRKRTATPPPSGGQSPGPDTNQVDDKHARAVTGRAACACSGQPLSTQHQAGARVKAEPDARTRSRSNDRSDREPGRPCGRITDTGRPAAQAARRSSGSVSAPCNVFTSGYSHLTAVRVCPGVALCDRHVVGQPRPAGRDRRAELPQLAMPLRGCARYVSGAMQVACRSRLPRARLHRGARICV
jgi:hypothetical protein